MSYQLVKPSIIRNIITKPLEHRWKEYDNTLTRFSKIIIETNNGTLTLNAIGDCCSDSWFELINNPKYDFRHLIGKKLYKVNSKIKEINMSKSRVQEYDQNHLCEFVLGNGYFKFILRNSSNGYYSGYVDFKFEKNHKIIKPKRINYGRLTIIVGLPCSGKTTLMNNEFCDSIIHDDFLDKNKVAVIINELINGNNVCIGDPRLCDFEQYNKLIERIDINKRYIQTILFDADKDTCIDNFKMTITKDKRIIKDIVNLHKCYSTENDYINKFVIPVYNASL